MFGFLKEKLKKAARIFSRKVEEEGKEVREEPLEEIKPEKEIIAETKISKKEEKPVKIKEKKREKAAKKKEKKKKEKKEERIEEVEEEPIQEEISEEGITEEKEIEEEEPEEIISEEEIKEEEKEEIKEEELKEEKVEKKKGFFARLKEKVTEKVTTRKINEKQFEEFFFELEIALMENNVAVEVIEKIKEELKIDLVNVPLKKGGVERIIEESLMRSVEEILDESDFDLIKAVKEKKEKPYVILFVGVNGSGKTTTIAKLGNYLKENKLSCVLAAGDTFRAASIEQLEEHGKMLGIKVIKHQYGADPSAVVFDAIAHARARGIDCVLVDTAGRQHSNADLMSEIVKIARVAHADLKLFVGEAVTGNDCIEQVREFNKAVGIDGIVLSKLDIDEKGGAALSVSYVSGKPILFVGVGQRYKDLEVFSKEKIVKSLGIGA